MKEDCVCTRESDCVGVVCGGVWGSALTSGCGGEGCKIEHVMREGSVCTRDSDCLGVVCVGGLGVGCYYEEIFIISAYYDEILILHYLPFIFGRLELMKEGCVCTRESDCFSIVCDGVGGWPRVQGVDVRV